MWWPYLISKSATEVLTEIASEIRECKKCRLWKTRKNPVPGEGNPEAKIVFIGEAPGYHEDVQGRPFVGAAGQLLTKMIESVLEIPRPQVYITNVVKCRPPNNREPTEEEIKSCSSYLVRQIEAIRPDIMVCLGRHSAKLILSRAGINFRSILSVRQKVFEVEFGNKKTKVLVTIHPAAALYKPPWRRFLEDDFRLLKSILIKEGEKSRGTTPTLDQFV